MGPDRIDGVLAANDTIAAGVISALKSARVKDLPPVTGQDANLDAVQRIVKGEQYMTVYKPFKAEADAAAAMAVALGRGEELRKIATTTTDKSTTRHIPSVLLTPRAVTVDKIKPTLVKDGMYRVDEICTAELRPACEKDQSSPAEGSDSPAERTSGGYSAHGKAEGVALLLQAGRTSRRAATVWERSPPASSKDGRAVGDLA